MNTSMAVAVALTLGVAVPMVGQDVASTERRGFFGLTLTCEDCFIQRGPGRVAYIRFPAISSVTDGSAAEAAGLRRGDTLISVDGLPLTTPEGFERYVAARPGVPLRLGIRRQGQDREVTIVPTERSSASTIREFYTERLRIAQRRGLEALRAAFRSPIGWLGIGIECSQCEIMTLSRRQQTWSFSQPPTVLTVDVDGPAHRGGLRRGDTLTAIDGVDLATREGGRAFGQIEPGQRVTLTVRRDGRERRVTLVAVARPDASREELAAFEEYRRTRDSSEAAYRDYVMSYVQRAQAEMQELSRQLRELELSRGSVDATRRRLASLDSLLRALRAAEREQQARGFSLGYQFGEGWRAAPTPPAAPVAPTPPTPMVAPTPPAIAYPRPTTPYPLRYSGRLAEVVNVEARAPGAVTVDELADSAVVINTGFATVTLTLRCLVPPSQVRVAGDSILVRATEPACRRVVVAKP